MTIKDMHYDLKKKINKVDSQKYKNLLVPEIDWALNEAQELYIKLILQPKLKDYLGSQITQRTLDDIYTIIAHEKDDDNCVNVVNNIASLPEDYWYYLSSFVVMTKGACTNVEGKVFIRQHDDEFERSSFDFSSFAWRTVNAVFFDRGVRFYTDNFTISSFCVSYIKRLNYIHNAEDFRDGKYALPSGEILGQILHGGTLTIDSVATSNGNITVTINATAIVIPVTTNDQTFEIGKRIADYINDQGTFQAFWRNSQLDIVGGVTIATLTFAAGGTGVTATATADVTVGDTSVDCILPLHTHREIVDLAVMLLSGEMGNIPEYKFSQQKVMLNLNKTNNENS